ncbi:hypothetical protein N1851_035215 [Merluccius polli]|uniref:Uncharacterized protein n=1 Tax=Merluccius polli TaxID=89951 RepID=A0AA47LYZ1_MERPO|nr:hypothetical protein N1851_035215 [Merluccius polli]
MPFLWWKAGAMEEGWSDMRATSSYGAGDAGPCGDHLAVPGAAMEPITVSLFSETMTEANLYRGCQSKYTAVKTELVTPKVEGLLLDEDGCPVCPSPEVHNLGVILDSFQSHIKYQYHQICFLPSQKLHPSQTPWPRPSHPCLHHLSSGFLPDRVLSGEPSEALDRLQYVQNSAARVPTHTRPWQRISPTLIHLHRLPVKSRISYKILLLIFKSLHTYAPSVPIRSPSPPYPMLAVLRSSVIHKAELLNRYPASLGVSQKLCVCGLAEDHHAES